MATARKAMGTELRRGDGGGPETFTKIGRLRNFKGPNLAQEQIDVTDLGNTSNYAEYLVGLKDSGEVTVEITWDPADAQHAAMLTDDFEAQTLRNFQIAWANSGVKWSFSAFVQKFAPKGDPKSALTADLTFRITNAVNFAA